MKILYIDICKHKYNDYICIIKEYIFFLNYLSNIYKWINRVKLNKKNWKNLFKK